MLWMICYDISDDRARRRVDKELRSVGERVQWSVFECVLSPPRLERLSRELRQYLDPSSDSIRYYPLCSWCEERVDWHGQGRRTDDPELWIV